ncbi:hypothetical protein D3C71_939380 [compost metagenome]
MVRQVEKMTTAQVRLIACALRQLIVDTVPLKRLSGQLFAVVFVFAEQRVTIVLQRWPELGGHTTFQQAVRTFQVIVPLCRTAGAHAETSGEPADDRMLRHHSRAIQIRRFAQFGEVSLVIGKYQQMTFAGMLVMPCDAVLGTQTLDKLEIRFSVLSAIVAWGTGLDVEGKSVGQDAVPLEYLGDDLRHRLVLKNSMIVPELQIVQCRHQVHAVVVQAFADFISGHTI